MLARLWRLARSRRAIALAAVLLLAAGLWRAWPAIHVYARAAALTGDAVLRLPVRPLAWFTGDPSTSAFGWEGGGRGLLTLPAGDAAEPAIVLVLGADPSPADDARVRRLTEGLARSGFAVLLTLGGALADGLVLPSEAPRLAGAFEALAAHPRVRADRIGYVGLSAGGSLAIVAAAQPEIADEVAWVLAIGPYYDAATLAVAVLSHAARGPDGTAAPWEPEAIPRRVVRRTLLAALPAAERDAIEGGVAPSSPAGAAVAALLDRPPIAVAEALIAGLGPEQRALLEAVSPRHRIAGLRAPLYLLHDRGDAFIPWTESEALAAAHPPAVYHRLDLFEHVDPDPGNLGHVLRDGWRLLRLIARVMGDSR